MTLPITESILHGELRPAVLSSWMTDKDLSKLEQRIREFTPENAPDLPTIEQGLINALEREPPEPAGTDTPHPLVMLTQVYHDDRDIRLGAQKARDSHLFVDDPVYTPVSTVQALPGLFPARSPTTLAGKLQVALLKAEMWRTEQAMLSLSRSARNDADVRTTLRELFALISRLCKDSCDDDVRETLTVLYFELYHTFLPVLRKGYETDFETDFENFVYEWKGAFPEPETMQNYRQLTGVRPAATRPVDNRPAPAPLEPPKPKNRVDRFLEAAEQFGFSQMPLTRELDSGRLRLLVECLLADKGSDADTFGHAAAMILFLHFYEWIKEHHIAGYKLKQFDHWCTKNIMEKAAGFSFIHYRLSVNIDPDDKKNDSYRYKGWKYKNSVREEYKALLDS